MINKQIIEHKAKKEIRSNRDDRRRLQQLNADNDALLHVIQLLGNDVEELAIATKLIEMAQKNIKEMDAIYRK
jgi:Tfp pilus assembly protein PilN